MTFNYLQPHEKMTLWIETMKPNIEDEIKKIERFNKVTNKQKKRIFQVNFRGLMSYGN